MIGGAPLPARLVASRQSPTSRLQMVHRPPILSIKISCSPQNLAPLLFFFSPSKCRGFTCISEDSSEITFLLVENYIPDRSQLASAGWGIFGKKITSRQEIYFLSFIANVCLSSVARKDGLGTRGGLVDGWVWMGGRAGLAANATGATDTTLSKSTLGSFDRQPKLMRTR